MLPLDKRKQEVIMLNLTRYIGQSIIIGDDIVVTVSTLPNTLVDVGITSLL